jgi:hypothetical protein
MKAEMDAKNKKVIFTEEEGNLIEQGRTMSFNDQLVAIVALYKSRKEAAPSVAKFTTDTTGMKRELSELKKVTAVSSIMITDEMIEQTKDPKTKKDLQEAQNTLATLNQTKTERIKELEALIGSKKDKGDKEEVNPGPEDLLLFGIAQNILSLIVRPKVSRVAKTGGRKGGKFSAQLAEYVEAGYAVKFKGAGGAPWYWTLTDKNDPNMSVSKAIKDRGHYEGIRNHVTLFIGIVKLDEAGNEVGPVLAGLPAVEPIEMPEPEGE